MFKSFIEKDSSKSANSSQKIISWKLKDDRLRFLRILIIMVPLVKEVTIDVFDSLMPGEKRSEFLSRETNPGPLN